MESKFLFLSKHNSTNYLYNHQFLIRLIQNLLFNLQFQILQLIFLQIHFRTQIKDLLKVVMSISMQNNAIFQ